MNRQVRLMKNLFLIGGPMGVGKSTVGQVLKKKLPNSVFLDGDWCWDANPFVVNEETKRVVMENICFLLKNFLMCSAYENIIFCWVMHEQKIIDELLANLPVDGCHVTAFSLLCREAELRLRLQKDMDAGLRSDDIIERSITKLPLYKELATIKIDTSGMNAEAAADTLLLHIK